jgi:hypothetical protein
VADRFVAGQAKASKNIAGGVLESGWAKAAPVMCRSFEFTEWERVTLEMLPWQAEEQGTAGLTREPAEPDGSHYEVQPLTSI